MPTELALVVVVMLEELRSQGSAGASVWCRLSPAPRLHPLNHPRAVNFCTIAKCRSIQLLKTSTSRCYSECHSEYHQRSRYLSTWHDDINQEKEEEKKECNYMRNRMGCKSASNVQLLEQKVRKKSDQPPLNMMENVACTRINVRLAVIARKGGRDKNSKKLRIRTRGG